MENYDKGYDADYESDGDFFLIKPRSKSPIFSDKDISDAHAGTPMYLK